MSIIDIIILAALVWSLYKGYKEGIVLQMGGIVGVFLGVWLAFKFAMSVGGFFGLSGISAKVIGFIIIIAAVLTLIAICGRLARGLFKFTGLEMVDTIGGALLSMLKMGLVLSILLVSFDAVNRNYTIVSKKNIEKSKLYTPIKRLSDYLFPYVDLVKGKFSQEFNDKGNE